MAAATSKRIPEIRTDTRRILDGIRRIVRELRRASRDAEKRVGLSAAQLFVLQKLAEGGALSVNELAERTHTHQSSVSVVVQRLVDRGLVDRVRSRKDGRQAEVSVTPAGKLALRAAPKAAQDQIIAALDRLGVKEKRRFADSMDQLIHEIGIDGEAATMLFEDDPPTPTRRARSSRRARNATGE